MTQVRRINPLSLLDGGGPEPPESGFRIKYAAELAEPLPPIDWLCEGYSLARGSYCLVAGESYSGKSLWIADLALSVAAGQSALGLFGARKGRVLWLDYDGQGDRITRARLQRMARVRGLDLAALDRDFGYAWLPESKLDGPTALDDYARALEGVALVVVDSWRGACPNTDEKDRGTVQRAGETIMRVIEKTGATMMMVDHTTKPPREEKKGGRSAMHDIHGSTAKAELAQWVAVFEKYEGKPVKVIHTKERLEARTMEPFGLRYDDVAMGDDLHWGLRVTHLDKEQMTDNQDALVKMKEKILKALRAARRPLESANAICARVEGRRSTVLEALRELIDEGKVVATSGADGPFELPHRAGSRAVPE